MLFLFRSAPEVEKRIHSKLFRKFWRSRGTKEPAYITVPEFRAGDGREICDMVAVWEAMVTFFRIVPHFFHEVPCCPWITHWRVVFLKTLLFTTDWYEIGLVEVILSESIYLFHFLFKAYFNALFESLSTLVTRIPGIVNKKWRK